MNYSSTILQPPRAVGPDIISQRLARLKVEEDQRRVHAAEKRRLKEEQERQLNAARTRLTNLTELLLAQPTEDLDALRSRMHELNQSMEILHDEESDMVKAALRAMWRHLKGVSGSSDGDTLFEEFVTEKFRERLREATQADILLLKKRDNAGDFHDNPDEFERQLDGLLGMGLDEEEVYSFFPIMEDGTQQQSSSSSEQGQKEGEGAMVHEQSPVAPPSSAPVNPPMSSEPPHVHEGATMPNASGSASSMLQTQLASKGAATRSQGTFPERGSGAGARGRGTARGRRRGARSKHTVAKGTSAKIEDNLELVKKTGADMCAFCLNDNFCTFRTGNSSCLACLDNGRPCPGAGTAEQAHREVETDNFTGVGNKRTRAEHHKLPNLPGMAAPKHPRIDPATPDYATSSKPDVAHKQKLERNLVAQVEMYQKQIGVREVILANITEKLNEIKRGKGPE